MGHKSAAGLEGPAREGQPKLARMVSADAELRLYIRGVIVSRAQALSSSAGSNEEREEITRLDEVCRRLTKGAVACGVILVALGVVDARGRYSRDAKSCKEHRRTLSSLVHSAPGRNWFLKNKDKGTGLRFNPVGV